MVWAGPSTEGTGPLAAVLPASGAGRTNGRAVRPAGAAPKDIEGQHD